MGKLTEGQKGNLWLAVAFALIWPFGMAWALIRRLFGRPE